MEAAAAGRPADMAVNQSAEATMAAYATGQQCVAGTTAAGATVLSAGARPAAAGTVWTTATNAKWVPTMGSTGVHVTNRGGK